MAKATKRGKKWRCLVFSHYEYKDGKKIRKYKSFTADSKKEAERLAAVWEYDQAQSAGKLSVHDAIDQYITVKEATEVKTAAMLAAFGSMRRSEICALKPSDFGDGTVTVQRAIVKKSNGKWVEKKTNKTVKSHRTVVLPPQVIAGIALSNDPIISLNPDQLSKRFRKAVKHAGMPQAFCLHALRHYYVSIAHVLGIPDAYVMKMGGWQTDYVMKRNYRSTLSDVEKKEQAKLNKHFAKIF